MLVLLTLLCFFTPGFLHLSFCFFVHFSLRDFIHSVEDFISGKTKKVNLQVQCKKYLTCISTVIAPQRSI